MPKAHHLYVAHSSKPSLADLAFLINGGGVDPAIRKVAAGRWFTRLKEVCEEEGTMDYEIVSIMPVEDALKIMELSKQ